MNARRVYKALLRLYPRDYRAMFASEMLAAFEQAAAAQHSRGFLLAELSSLLAGAASEWIAKLTTDDSVRGRLLPDRLLMRPPGVPWELHYAGAFEVEAAERNVKLLIERMVHAIAHHDFEGARRCARQERNERENLRLLRQKYHFDE